MYSTGGKIGKPQTKIQETEYKHEEEYFYVRQYMPEVPMGTLCMLIPSKKYYINMRFHFD